MKQNGTKFEMPWSPTTEASRQEFYNIMEAYGRNISPEKGLSTWIAYRDMVGQIFPGNLPAPAVVAILTIIAANAVSSVFEQMEGALEMATPEAVGRRQATVEIFGEILNKAVMEREKIRLNRFAGIAGAGQS